IVTGAALGELAPGARGQPRILPLECRVRREPCMTLLQVRADELLTEGRLLLIPRCVVQLAVLQPGFLELGYGDELDQLRADLGKTESRGQVRHADLRAVRNVERSRHQIEA